MVKFYGIKYALQINWDTVSFAYLSRYPNPFATHVLSVDTLKHEFDAETGDLTVVRLYKKTNAPPSWAKRILSGLAHTAYIMEEMVVNEGNKTLVAKQRNITHTRFLVVEDKMKIVGEADGKATIVRCEGGMMSRFGYGVSSRIEGFSVNRIKDNLNKSKEGLLYTIEKVLTERKLKKSGEKAAVFM